MKDLSNRSGMGFDDCTEETMYKIKENWEKVVSDSIENQKKNFWYHKKLE
jgi:hypothetical protein